MHVTALGGLPFDWSRHAANQDDEHHRDRGADDVTQGPVAPTAIAALVPPASRDILRTATRA